MALYQEQRNTSKIDWDRVREVVAGRRFFPVPVSVGAPSLDEIIASIKPQPYDFEPYGVEANQGMPPEESR